MIQHQLPTDAKESKTVSPRSAFQQKQKPTKVYSEKKNTIAKIEESRLEVPKEEKPNINPESNAESVVVNLKSVKELVTEFMSAESGSKNTSFQKRQSVDSISAQSLKSLSF